MKRLLASSCVVLLVVVLGTFAHGQNPIPSSENARHQLAIDLLRSINTAELDYKLRHTGYADWKTLVTNAYFTSSGTNWAPKDSPLAKLQFSKSSEILPEWSLRLISVSDRRRAPARLASAGSPRAFWFARTAVFGDRDR